MRPQKVFFGVLLIACLGWIATQSEETIGNLSFKIPPGWTKKPYRNEIELKPGDVSPGEWCNVTIKASLQANGGLVDWVNGQAAEFLRGREVLMNSAIPYQDDPKGWEGCGLSFAVRVNANTPTYYHMFIGFRRGNVAGTMHFVTDKLEYTQKYQQQIGVISSSLQPVNGFGSAGASTPPLANPLVPPPPDPAGPLSPANSGAPSSTPSTLYLPSELPPPAAQPSGDERQEAEALAKLIVKGGQEGLPALERAVLECGFSIHGLPSRQVIHDVSAPEFNGMSFADIDLVGANELERSHSTVTLGELQESYRNLKAVHETDFISLWRGSLESCRTSPRRSDRFYAALLTALGTSSNGLEADFKAIGPESRIGGVQLFLLAWRTAGHATAAMKHQEDSRDVGHGPRDIEQDAGCDALRDLRTTVDHYAHTDWDAAMKHMTSIGKLNPQLYFLAMARMQLMLAFFTGTGELDELNRPLVREKTKGKTGEPRNVSVYIRYAPNQASWNKFTIALKSCGYEYEDIDQKAWKLFVSLECGKKAVQNRGKHDAKLVGDTGAGSWQYDAPVEGAPQQRVISSSAEKQFYNVEVNANVTIDAPKQQETGRVVQAQREVWGETILSNNWMAMTKQIPVSIRVQDWKGTGWQGTVTVSLKGGGKYKDVKSKASGYVAIDRLFVTQTTFDYSTPTAIITRSPVGQGVYTAMPGSEPKGVYKVDDELYFEGDIGGCGKLMGSRKTTWKERDATNNIEEQGLRRKPSVEINSLLKLYSVSFFNNPPYIPATKRIVEKVKTTVKSDKSQSVRVGFYDGVDIKDTDRVKNGSAVFNVIHSEDEGELSGQARAAYSYTGFYQDMQVVVMATFDWNLSNGGGQMDPSLQSKAGLGLALLQMGDFTARTLRELRNGQEASPELESDELATCYATEAPVRDQLKHVTGRSRSARLRANR